MAAPAERIEPRRCAWLEPHYAEVRGVMRLVHPAAGVTGPPHRCDWCGAIIGIERPSECYEPLQ
jgi:hypothetical protein